MSRIDSWHLKIESIRDIIIYPHIKFWWYRKTLNFYRPYFMPCFGSHYENGRYLENLQNAELYSPFFPCTMNLSTADRRNYRTEFHETWWSYRYMFLVDPKVFRFVVKGVKATFWKWRPVEILQCRESIPDIIIYQLMKFRWNRTMLNLCGIVVAILKMAIGRNFSMSGIDIKFDIVIGHH
jgi:hypothetical protein